MKAVRKYQCICMFCGHKIKPVKLDQFRYKVQCINCLGSIDFEINIEPFSYEGATMR